MKFSSLLTAAALVVGFSSSAFAGNGFLRMNCLGKKATGESFFLSILDNGSEPASVSLTAVGPNNDQSRVVSLSNKDVIELTSGWYRLNVVAAHHNTVIKISADVNLFGGNIANPEEASFNGKAYFSDNLVSSTGSTLADVVCRTEI